MGLCQSRLERQEAVSRCKARRRYTKQLVQARRDMAAAHALELTVVAVPRGGGGAGKKDLAEIATELDEYFLKAADAGARVAALLEAPNCEPPETNNSSFPGKTISKSVTRLSSILLTFHLFLTNYLLHATEIDECCREGTELRQELEADGMVMGRKRVQQRGDEGMGNGGSSGILSHSSTVEKLYAWEKKLFLEVKSYEGLKQEHDKKIGLLRKQEVKGVDYLKMEKNKMEIESLDSKMLVATQSIETTTSEIMRLRESELFPQLLELVAGLMSMWRGMYECHQVQTHMVQQLEYLNNSLSTNPTSNVHRQAALQLEIEVDRWYSAFCSLVKSQRDYVYSLTGWLRLSLFQSYHDPHNKAHQNSDIYSLCEEWQLAIDRIPDKVASEGIKTLLTVIHAVVVQQAEEQKQKKRSESAFKELEKKAEELRSLESKYGPYSGAEGYGDMSRKSPVSDKRAKVEALRCRADEEKSKYEKSIGVTRAMTLNNLQTGFPNVFQAMTGFASVCMETFESVYNFKSSDRILDSKRLLT
uniref:DUF632 domain-containing protein n=1 Tax=Oryza barthii TaxID=65489 RepID=A0A0D3H9G4_9ORYZ